MITIKRIEFILLATAVGIVFLVGIPLMLSGCKQPNRDTEDIDGGVRHQEDTDAPKVIASTQIVSFSCEFSAYDLAMDSSPIAGRYHTLYAAQNGGTYEARGGGTVYDERKFTPDKAFFDRLQQIVAKYDLAQYNGKSYTVSGLPPDYGAKLNIRYASGESIYASNNQSCFLPVEAMEDLVNLFKLENENRSESYVDF